MGDKKRTQGWKKKIIHVPVNGSMFRLLLFLGGLEIAVPAAIGDGKARRRRGERFSAPQLSSDADIQCWKGFCGLVYLFGGRHR